MLLGVITWIQDDIVWPHVEVNERILGHRQRKQSTLLAHDLSKSFSLEKEFKFLYRPCTCYLCCTRGSGTTHKGNPLGFPWVDSLAEESRL